MASFADGSGTRDFLDGNGTAAKFNYPYGVVVMGEGLQFGEKVVISRKMVYSFNKELKMKVQSYCLVLGLMGLLASCKAPTSSTSSPGSPSPPSSPDKAWVVSTLAGSGEPAFLDATGTAAKFNSPNGVAVDSVGNLYVADASNNRIRKITAEGVVTTLAGSGEAAFLDGSGTAAKFNYPSGVAVDSSGNVYVADSFNHRIRKITKEGVVSTLAGSGDSAFLDATGTAAKFNWPRGVAVDSNGIIYVADGSNNRIRKITSEGVVSTLAGSGEAAFLDGSGTAAKFNNPSGVAVDSGGNLYVADSSNHRIRKITSEGVVSTLTGSGERSFADGIGTAAKFNEPNSVAVDSGGIIYVADEINNRIRKITINSSGVGVVTTLAGSGERSFADGIDTAAKFSFPRDVAVDSGGNLYVADASNHRIRKIEYKVPVQESVSGPE